MIPFSRIFFIYHVLTIILSRHIIANQTCMLLQYTIVIITPFFFNIFIIAYTANSNLITFLLIQCTVALLTPLLLTSFLCRWTFVSILSFLSFGSWCFHHCLHGLFQIDQWHQYTFKSFFDILYRSKTHHPRFVLNDINVSLLAALQICSATIHVIVIFKRSFVLHSIL